MPRPPISFEEKKEKARSRQRTAYYKKTQEIRNNRIESTSAQQGLEKTILRVIINLTYNPK